MDFKALVGEIKNAFERMPEISLGYLFGSQVEGRQGTLSDYDLAVLIDSYPPEKPIQALLS